MKFSVIFVLLMFVLTLTAQAQAATHNVSTVSDLESTINSANSGDTIIVASGDYKLTQTLTISKSITLKSSGAVTLDGNNTCRVIKIGDDTGSSPTVTIEGFTIKNGKTEDVSNGTSSSTTGGGIDAYTCKLTVTNCRFENNYAENNGGGISIFSSGSFDITNCTFINNQANTNNGNNSNEGGGGIFVNDNNYPLDVKITNCTFTGNTSKSSNSGALCVGATDASKTTVSVNYCTFATDSDKMYVNSDNTLNVKNSIIRAVNVKDKVTSADSIINTAALTSEDVTVTSGNTTITHTVFRKYAQLFNAIDKGSDTTVTTDQLGNTVTGNHDIGAVEIAGSHEHSYTYSANGATITATCNGTGICTLTDKKATLTINAPANLEYDGNAKSATISGSIPGVNNPSIVYSPSSPINAGDYTASITLGTATASVKFTITKKTATLDSLDIAFDNNAWAKSICQGETATANFKTTVTAAYSDGKNETVSSPALTLNKAGTWPSWLTFSENGGNITVTANPGTDAATGNATHYLDVTASYGGKTATARLILTFDVQASQNTIDLHFIKDPITMTAEQAGYAEKMFISRVDYACDYLDSNGNKASLAPNWSIEDSPGWLAVNEGVLVADLRKVNVEPGEYAATLKATANYMGVTATATAKVKVTVTGYTELEVTAPDSVMVVYAGFSESRLDLKPLITVRGLHSVRGWETVNYSSREIAQSGNWPSWLTIEDFVAVGKAPAGTEPGNYEYEYEVTVNKDNMFGTGKCRLTVYVSDKSELEPAKITMDSDALPYAQEGTPYSAKIYATGDAPIKWTVDSNTPLPDGLTLNENTGEISGTPTAKNAGQIKGSLIYVSNPANASNPDQRYFIIAVQGVPPSDWKITRNPVKVSKGETFEVTFRVTKGRSVYYNTVEYPDKTYLKKVIAQNASEAGEGYIKYTLVWPEKKEQKYKFQIKATNKYGWSNKSKTVTVRSTGKIASVGDDIDYGFITIAEDDDEYEDSGTYANGYTTDNIETESGVTYFSDGGTGTGVIGGSSSYKTLAAYIASLKEEDFAEVIRLEFRKGAEDSIITAEDLEKFTGLTELAVDESEKLAGINLNGNKTLQSVTVFDCPALEKIYAESCTALVLLGASKCPKLADINVEGCQSLETLWLDGSAVTKLDLSGSEFANVSNIDVAGCTSLDVLKVDGCKALSDLYAPYTAVTELNLSNNPELTGVFLNQTKVSTLDLSKNAKLKSLSLAGAENLAKLELADGVQLEDFDISGSKVAELNAYKGNEKIVSLDLTSNTQLTSLDLTDCKNLKELNISGTNISSLTLAGCSSLEILRASNCKNLTGLSLDKDNANLMEIYLSGSGIKTLPVSGCYSLEKIKAGGCAGLTSLALDKDNSNLKEIYLSGTGLKTLDVGACEKLTSLDVSNCADLTSLNAKGCSLKWLDVTGCAKLSELDCSENQLGWLNLDNLTALSTVNYSGQKIYGWIPDTKMKLSDYIGSNDIGRVADILAYGANENGIETTIEDEDGNVVKADTEYYAVFKSVPEKVVYYYDTKFSGEPMDVTLTGESSPVEMGGSGGGCGLVRSEELGMRSESVLLLALFVLAFALLKKSGIKNM